MKDFFEQKHVITEIVLAIYLPKAMGGATHRNRASHGFAFNLEGEKKYVFDDGKVLTVKQNDIIYLPKRSNYDATTLEKGEMFCINFQLLDDEDFEPFVMRIPNTEQVLKAYQDAEKVWKNSKDGREYQVLTELYKIFYQMQKFTSLPYLPETKQSLIKPAIDYIHKHYTEELLNAERLSSLCGISYDYFRKLFEKFYGCSPIKYINALKINRAKELLSTGLYTVSETAFLSGFSDVSHFSRFFKQNVGVLPSEYIK